MSELALELIAENKKTRSPFLDLGNCGLTEVSEEIGELVWLETLIFSNECWEWDGVEYRRNSSNSLGDANRINLLPSKLVRLKNLNTLILNGNPINDLTPLANLVQLQTLECSGTQINDLISLTNLVQLQTLDCFGTQVSDLAPLANLVQLQTLKCFGTEVNDLTPLTNLIQLQTLECYGTEVSNLTPLANLVQLKILECFCTPVSDLTPLTNLTQLQSLHCSSTQVSDLTPLANLVQLQTLECSDTQISDLTPLANLQQLQKLDCSYTEISDLTPLLPLIKQGLQVKLESYGGNGIYVKDCPLTNPPPEIVKQGNAAILKYFDEIALKNTFHNTEIKCILLGNSTAGKTSLVDFLTQKQYQSNKSSTHGILSNSWKTEFSDQELIANIWDFGGQEYYHATHRLFLSQNAVYCLVWDAKTNQGGTYPTEVYYDDDPNPYYEEIEHNSVQWWLRNVQHFTSRNQQLSVPLLVVQNKAERDGLQNISDQIADFTIEYECLNNHISIEQAAQNNKRWQRNFEDFEEKLLQTLHDKCSHYKFPVYCRDVRNEIAELKQTQKWLLRSDFENLCRKYDATAEIELIDIYLRDITGEILFYPNNNQLKDRVFLDSAWVCTQIYKILSRDVRNKNQGAFNIDWVKTALGVENDDAEHFLAIMREFELIFAETNEDGNSTGNFIAPQYLPDTCADIIRWDELKDATNPTYAFTLWFKNFLPKSVMARFVAHYGVAAQKKLYWKNGLCLKIAGCYAFVERIGDNKIQVYIQAGEKKNTATQRIFNTFLTIEENTPNFAVSVNQQQFVNYGDLETAFRQGAQRVKSLSNTGKLTDNLIPIEPFALFNPATITMLENIKQLKSFISYSHKDEVLKDRFLVHLKTLKRQGKIAAWEDRMIRPGEEWDNEIKQALHDADIIFFLLSADAVASDYIMDVEVETAMERHQQKQAIVIPIIFNYCEWLDTPLAKLQGLPRDGKPIVAFANSDEAFNNIIIEIRNRIETFNMR